MAQNEEVSTGAQATAKQNRAEKKARKAVQKVGVKPVAGITRVTIKKSKNILFVVQNPDVYRCPQSDTYIIFGEAKIEDLNAQSQAAAAEQFKKAEPQMPAVIEEEEEDDANVDTNGLDDNDIQMVIDQANVTKSKAVAALRSNNGDIVNAIMELTM